VNAVGGRVLRRSVTAEPDPTVAGVCDEDHRSKARASKRSVTTKCAVDLQAGTQTTGRQTTGRQTTGRPADRQTGKAGRQVGAQRGGHREGAEYCDQLARRGRNACDESATIHEKTAEVVWGKNPEISCAHVSKGGGCGVWGGGVDGHGGFAADQAPLLSSSSPLPSLRPSSLSRFPLYTWSKAKRHDANAFLECFSAWVTPALPALPSSLLLVPPRADPGASSERSIERDILVVIETLGGEGNSG